MSGINQCFAIFNGNFLKNFPPRWKIFSLENKGLMGHWFLRTFLKKYNFVPSKECSKKLLIVFKIQQKGII